MKEKFEQIEVSTNEIESTKSHVFFVEQNGEFYQPVYPEPLSELGAFFDNEVDAYYQLVLDRVTQKSGSNWGIQEPAKTAQILWGILADRTVDEDDNLDEDFLHFKAGTYKFDIHNWFEDYFDVSIAKDLEQVA
ncbi:MAG: hypothetical protein JJV99_10525 [Colwellia sp.]|nr:hypothetical protein [Colwellia sp.]